MLTDELQRLKRVPVPEIRKFGLVVGGVFSALGIWFLIRHKPSAWALLGPGLGLVLLGAGWPRALRRIYVVWMSLAILMGLIVSTVLLTVLFFLVMSPLGLLARLCGQDFLRRKLDRKAMSYWQDRPPSERPARERLERQF